MTSHPGIFAAGDCRTKEVRQLTTAAADGSVVGIGRLVKYLSMNFKVIKKIKIKPKYCPKCIIAENRLPTFFVWSFFCIFFANSQFLAF